MGVLAATLANGGVCPLTNEEVFPADIIKKTLAVMQSCGMYDASGEFLCESLLAILYRLAPAREDPINLQSTGCRSTYAWLHDPALA